MRKRRFARLAAAALLAAGVLLIAAGVRLKWERRDTTQPELDRIAQVMRWHRGEVIAEIGAGGGTMSLMAARRVGPEGRVLTNEVDPAALAKLKRSADAAGFGNLVVVEGKESGTNLPDECCEAVFMRWVYHHLARPEDIDSSLFRATRPNGLLAIADFPPSYRHQLKLWLKQILGRRNPKENVHEGVPAEDVIRQVSAAGFVFEGRIEQWPGKGYCLIFRKPLRNGSGQFL